MANDELTYMFSLSDAEAEAACVRRWPDFTMTVELRARPHPSIFGLYLPARDWHIEAHWTIDGEEYGLRVVVAKEQESEIQHQRGNIARAALYNDYQRRRHAAAHGGPHV